MDDNPKGRCDLDERFEYTDAFFGRNKHLKKIVRDGHVYAIT